MLLPQLSHISEAYLVGLCDDETMESSTLDFKLELSGGEEKRELHKDLCPFANASGGDNENAGDRVHVTTPHPL